MKTNRYTPCLWALAALIGLMFSCTLRETETPDNPAVEAASGESFAYIVVPEEGGEDASGWEVVEPVAAPASRLAAAPATRTDFDSFVGKFTWSEGDKIAIHMNNGTYYETPVTPATGAFTASSTASIRRDCYAVYPASVADAANYGNPTLKVVLPSEYDITGNLASDYSPVPMVAVNNPAESDLYFRHVGGLLRITCDRVPVGTQKIAVTLDRNIAGSFAVANPASENPTITTGGSTATVTFKVAADALAEVTNGIILNLPVPVGTVNSIRVKALNASNAVLYTAIREKPINVPRYHGRKCIISLTDIFYDSMQMVVTAGSETAYQFTMPFLSTETLPADLRIIWGDGAYTDIPAGSAVSSVAGQLTHTYASAGDYTITLEATAYSADSYMIPALMFYVDSDTSLFADSRKMLKSLPTAALYMDADGHNLFRSCPNLVTVSGKLFSKNPHFTLFERTFQESGLTAIPDGLFDNNPEALSFRSMFWHCFDLAGSIPEDLFAHCPKTKSFFATFSNCESLTGEIPEDLFAHCPEDTTFTSTFYYCSGLSGSIPEGLFRNNVKAESFLQTFCGCTGLTGEIPEHLFDGCPDVTTFWSTFIRCTGLTGTIPANLFKHQTKVKSFRQTFCECTGLSGPIPSDLFSTNLEVELFQGTFQRCSTLVSQIPADLFRGQSKVITYARVFADSPEFYGPVPEGLFDDSPLVQSFEWAFNGCTKLSGTLPSGLFSKHPKATNFSHVFRSCSSLSLVADLFTGTTYTPADRFASCTEQVQFEHSFSGIVSGTAPPLWDYTYGAGVLSTYCFYGGSSLSNGSAVPAGWK